MQISAFGRYSSLAFSPDVLVDLLFSGISQRAFRRADRRKLACQRTIRAGVTATVERSLFNTTSHVLPVDASGAQTSDVPLTINDSGGMTGGLHGAYRQDEWRVLPKVTINFGARFDAVDQFTHENQLSPRVNVVWKATNTRPFTPATHATSFRRPSSSSPIR